MARRPHEHRDRCLAEPELDGFLGHERIVLDNDLLVLVTVDRKASDGGHDSVRTTRPAFTFGSNQVDFGGIDRRMSAMRMTSATVGGCSAKPTA